MSRALVTLAEKGVEAEAKAKARLSAVNDEFMAAEGVKKNGIGEELIRAIFRGDAIAEGPLR